MNIAYCVQLPCTAGRLFSSAGQQLVVQHGTVGTLGKSCFSSLKHSGGWLGPSEVTFHQPMHQCRNNPGHSSSSEHARSTSYSAHSPTTVNVFIADFHCVSDERLQGFWWSMEMKI